MYAVQSYDYFIVATFRTFGQAIAYLQACLEAGERGLKIIKLSSK